MRQTECAVASEDGGGDWGELGGSRQHMSLTARRGARLQYDALRQTCATELGYVLTMYVIVPCDKQRGGFNRSYCPSVVSTGRVVYNIERRLVGWHLYRVEHLRPWYHM